MTRPEPVAADLIRELTRPYTTTERVLNPVMRPIPTTAPETRVTPWWEFAGRFEWTLHAVHHKALLDQLEDAITGATSLADEDAGRSTFTSKPAARVDALDVLARIDTQAHDLAVQLGIENEDHTLTKAQRKPLRDRLLAISGKVGDKPHHRVKAWWVAARIATQWDARPFQPKGAPCPVTECEQFGTLRVRFTDQLASCTACGAVWDGPAEVQNLARHVKWATDHELSKGRHWLLDDEHELVECVECLPTRDAMGERAVLRAKLEQQRGKVAS